MAQPLQEDSKIAWPIMPKTRDSDKALKQFNRLIEEILRGGPARGRYQKWEIDILLDIESCNMEPAAAAKILPLFQQEVQREMSKGARPSLRLSDFLKSGGRNRLRRETQ